MVPRTANPLAALACCILLAAVSAGCTESPLITARATMPEGDPEIAIAYWMDAMNRQDIMYLYRHSPSYVRSTVTLEQFAAENRENVYFVRNVTFTRYEIINKTVEGNTADIRAMLVMRDPSDGSSPEELIPIWFHFTLQRENNQWKVWTAP